MRVRLLAVFLICFAGVTAAAETEQIDSLLSVKLDGGYEQRGVLTMVKGDAPSVLVLLFPGDPSVLKAEVVDGKLVKSRVRGNPLVRARNLLVRPGLAAVLVDCRSDQPEQCEESYIMSRERFDDVGKLLARVRQDLPGIKKVWIVGHSLGTLSSASLARQGAGVFDGAIHVSTILASKSRYRSLVGYDFSAAGVPQVFIHHRNDPCPGTPLHEAESAASRAKIPIIVIAASGGTRGHPCGPFSEHGFAGADAELMDAVYRTVTH